MFTASLVLFQLALLAQGSTACVNLTYIKTQPYFPFKTPLDNIFVYLNL